MSESTDGHPGDNGRTTTRAAAAMPPAATLRLATAPPARARRRRRCSWWRTTRRSTCSSVPTRSSPASSTAPTPASAAALAEVSRRKPRVIVLDLMLPDLDGLEVCRRVKSERGNADLPVIILTALESEASPAAAR